MTNTEQRLTAIEKLLFETDQYRNSGGGELPYKVYTALLNQSGENAPVATVLQNTIGEITWTYENAGYYIATCTDCFTTDKTIVNLMINYNWDGCFNNIMTIISNDDISLQICAGDDFLTADMPAYIEIRVYP